MAHFYRSHPVFSCIVCYLAILRSIGGGNITWFEPLPSETVTDPSSVSTTNKSLIKGSLSEKLSCNFTLTAGLRIITVSMKIGRTAVATFVPSERAPAIESDFASRFHATWVPNKLTLILLNVTDAEEGDYLCQVVSVSPAQTWIRKIHVSLLVPPSITEIMGKTVREGENLTLRCLAEGKPTPHITWTRLSDNSVVTMPLINISRQDVRDYRCKAHNGVGTPASKKVSINVQYPVEAVGSGGNTTVHERGVTNFSCPVDGNPEPSIMWYEGTEVGGGKISSEKQLTVEVNSGESVCYTCVANNSLGTSVSITQCLIVKQHSTAPTHPSTPIPVGPPLTVIGLVTGVVVLVAVVIIGLVAWWVLKKRKLTKDRKQGELQHLEVDNMDSGEKLE